MCYSILKKDLGFFYKYLDDKDIYYFDSTFNFYGIRNELDFIILEIEFNNKMEILQFEKMWNLFYKNENF